MRRFFLRSNDRARGTEVGVAYLNQQRQCFWHWFDNTGPHILEGPVFPSCTPISEDNNSALLGGYYWEMRAEHMPSVLAALRALPPGSPLRVCDLPEVQAARVPPSEQTLVVPPPLPPKTNHKIGVPKGKLP